MKKTITRPDGTVEEVEGTAEELAELERASKKTSKKESKSPSRRVLTDEIQRLKNENDELKKKLEAAGDSLMKRLIEQIGKQPDQLPYVPYFPPCEPLPWREVIPSGPYWTGETICTNKITLRDCSVTDAGGNVRPLGPQSS